MANATPRFKKLKIRLSKTVPARKITLELTAEEAMTLYAFTGRVGGNPSDTARGYASNIRDALSEVGFEFNSNVTNPYTSGAQGFDFNDDSLRIIADAVKNCTFRNPS